MLVLPRSKPKKIDFNEAILLRLPQNHPKIPEIESDNGKRISGYKGEQSLDYLLEYLPDKDYYIFHGLRLFNGKTYFQIDTLIITPTYILIIETKNMNGELTFDEDSAQLIQKKNNEQKGYDDPLLQAKFHVRQLTEWLKKHQFPIVPIEYLVMMSNSNAILYIKNNTEARKRVCRGRQVVFRIEEFSGRFKEEKLNREVIRKLSRLLLKKHTEPSYDLEKSYKLRCSEILPGVHCPSCECLGMKYSGCYWHCPKCGAKSKDAHIRALKHYYLLFGPEITNKQFREFLLIDSINIAYRLLKKLKLSYTGTNRHRVYKLSFDKI